MARAREAALPTPSAETLRAELADASARDPRLLLDAALLGGFASALAQRLGDAEAAGTLLRLGFVQGFRDATRVVRSNAAAPGAGPRALPLVAMSLRPPVPSAEDGFSIDGTWPARAEAEACLGSRGRVDRPACWASAGYTSGWLSGIWELDILAVEQQCAACASPGCRFVARPEASWRALGDADAARCLPALPFDALRDAVIQELSDELSVSPSAAFDSESAAVHVWGPVMVVPYAGEETAAAVEAIGHDPLASSVSVVVLDLGGAILDDGFGASALEHTLDTIEAWGAEALVTGISALSEPALGGLERAPMVVRKGLPEAIAAAFRIAESQRHAS